MANKILIARGTKARLEEIKSSLIANELVYATDTKELGVKKTDGNIEYFKNATDIDAIITGKQDKLVAGDNITIDENTNEISASGVVTLTGEQTITGPKTFSNKLTVTNVDNATGLIIEKDVYMNNSADPVEVNVFRASGNISSNVLTSTATSISGITATMFNIGTLLSVNEYGVPYPYYMYLDSRPDGDYNNATLKVDSEDRVGVALAALSRPTQTLDVNGKIRMRTQTVTEDADDIVVTKGYIDTLLNHDIILIPDTAFTITQAHFNKTLIITSSSDVTITVPTQIVESIEKGFFCDIVRYGTGEVSFSGAGIVLNSAGPLSIDAQYIAASLIKIDDNNEWLLIGGRE